MNDTNILAYLNAFVKKIIKNSQIFLFHSVFLYRKGNFYDIPKKFTK